MGELTQMVKNLKEELEVGSSIKNAETILYEICDQNDPRSIELLIKLFDDNFRFDEFMFSIIHCIEKFETSTYVENLLKSIPEFIYQSPKWASIVHMRILNSETALLAYIKEIKERATIFQKESIAHLLNSINAVDPEFLAKTIPLLTVCKL